MKELCASPSPFSQAMNNPKNKAPSFKKGCWTSHFRGNLREVLGIQGGQRAAKIPRFNSQVSQSHKITVSFQIRTSDYLEAFWKCDFALISSMENGFLKASKFFLTRFPQPSSVTHD